MTDLARQHAEHPLVEIHDGVVAALVAVDDRVSVQPHDQKVTLRPRLLQEVQVANVEQIKGARHVHNPITWLSRKTFFNQKFCFD